MKKLNIKIYLQIAVVILVIGAFVFFFQRSNIKNQKQLSTMKLTSSAFANKGEIPSKYTCNGENINPPLKIENVPEKAKSLVLIVDDPDAPAGTWDHWLVWNVSPSVNEIKENSVPEGAIQGTNDFGKTPYGGPCPPSGTHNYHFKLYALDTKLNLDSSTKKGGLENSMKNHVLEQTSLIGQYKKK